jgi:predicted oxidoreductase
MNMNDDGLFGKERPVPEVLACEGGPALSRLVLGLWRLAEPRGPGQSPAEVLRLVEGCLEIGLTTFDHADIYGDYSCESIFGRALAQQPGLRPRMQLISKCGIKLVSDKHPEHRLNHYDTGRDHILAAAEQSLRRLGTDYLDLLLIHRPDPLMDADEVAEAFSRLRQAGKVRHFGVSNFHPWQFNLLASRLDFPLVTNQVELSVLHLAPLHDGTLDQCQQRRIRPMAWSPFGGGRLFGGEDDQARRVRQVLTDIGRDAGGWQPDQVALAWLLRHPAGVMPVLGTGRLERVRRAAAALSLELDRQQWFEIWRASTGQEVP